jgi:transposase-like protein
VISSKEQTMSPPRFTSEFKDEAVRQITERGYAVAEVSARLTHTQSGALTVNSQ